MCGFQSVCAATDAAMLMTQRIGVDLKVSSENIQSSVIQHLAFHLANVNVTYARLMMLVAQASFRQNAISRKVVWRCGTINP